MGSLASSLFIPIDYKWFQLADKWFPGKALRKVTRIFIHIKFDINMLLYKSTLQVQTLYVGL